MGDRLISTAAMTGWRRHNVREVAHIVKRSWAPGSDEPTRSRRDREIEGWVRTLPIRRSRFGPSEWISSLDWRIRLHPRNLAFVGHVLIRCQPIDDGGQHLRN
jgi:hypothetical protein